MTNNIQALNDIEEFIKFIIDLFNDEFGYCIGNKDAFYYFIQGGCYDLAQIIKHYFPSSEYVVYKDFEHCAILYNGVIYDAYSSISYDEYVKRFGIYARPEQYYKRIEDFKIYTKDEIDLFERPFGSNVKINGKPIVRVLVNELNRIDSIKVGDM